MLSGTQYSIKELREMREIDLQKNMTEEEIDRRKEDERLRGTSPLRDLPEVLQQRDTTQDVRPDYDHYINSREHLTNIPIEELDYDEVESIPNYNYTHQSVEGINTPLHRVYGDFRQDIYNKYPYYNCKRIGSMMIESMEKRRKSDTQIKTSWCSSLLSFKMFHWFKQEWNFTFLDKIAFIPYLFYHIYRNIRYHCNVWDSTKFWSKIYWYNFKKRIGKYGFLYRHLKRKWRWYVKN